MTKHAITTHKSHMSRREPLVAESARGARPGAPAPAPGVGPRHIPGLVFAPVRPGIVAACMVESLDSGRVPGADRPRWTGQSETDKKEYFADDREGLAGVSGASKLSRRENRTGLKTCP